MTLPRLTMHLLASLLIAPALLPAADAAGRDGGMAASLAGAIAVLSAGAVDVSKVPPSAAGLTQLWLRGAFGRVAGGSLAEPASAPPSGEPLDTYVLRAPLTLEVPADPGVTLRRIVATPLTGATPGSTPGEAPLQATSPAADAAQGGSPSEHEVLWAPAPADAAQPGAAVVFEGPATPGPGLIVAEVATAAGTQEVAWLVHVPDRQPPADGLYDIPAPGIVISSSSAQRAGRDGSGCYAYLCVDVGVAPPVEDLPTLPAGVDEVLTVSLADGSAVVGWRGRLSPLDVPRRDGREAEAGPLGPVGEAALSGLEAPRAGRWLLDLEVEFDRERGWMRTFLVVDAG